MDPDPFDDLLSLEDQFYQEGYALGAADGEKAGRIEGRAFGLEKGFEKYVEAGRLHGRSVVWASRIPRVRDQSLSQDQDQTPTVAAHSRPSNTDAVEGNANSSESDRLPDLPSNPRLEKHIRVLYALTEPVSLSTENTEDAVSDFDDRLKRAQGKVKIIERVIGEEGGVLGVGGGGENGGGQPSGSGSGGLADADVEDVSVLKARH